MLIGEDGMPVRSGKVQSRDPDMHDAEKSDVLVVPLKAANKEASVSAELPEGRGAVDGNTDEMSTGSGLQVPRCGPSIGLAGVRERAQRDSRCRFTALMHHLTPSLLAESFFALKRSAATGIDEVTWSAYENGLESRLVDLHERIHSGRYRARPSRRSYIAKADGGRRPLGIACLEDKIVQRAVTTVLASIYEVDFKNFSYGFRPERGAHDALDALSVGLTERSIHWVLDADIRGFFDTIDHGWLLRFLGHRIGDQRIIRLIQKWLRAGISEDGEWKPLSCGVPQGAVISPLLANIYLHYVLDWWGDHWRKTMARGQMIIVRYADDFVIGFQREADGRWFLEELRGRLQSFGLELHAGKTRLLPFGPFAKQHSCTASKPPGGNKPATFDFLGFTHICHRTQHGRFTVRRQTVAKRMRVKLKVIKVRLRAMRHDPIEQQGAWLRAVVQGWYNYHAVHYNHPMLGAFRRGVIRHWNKSLRKRSQKWRSWLNWKPFYNFVDKWIPRPKILHPWPNQRCHA